jgi:hypothetical protein
MARFYVLALLWITGCASMKPMSPHATVNDCSGGDYRVVAVDGKPEVRARHPIHTVVPVVHVPVGTHQITVRGERDHSESELTATVEADKHYRIEDTTTGPTLSADKHYRIEDTTTGPALKER